MIKACSDISITNKYLSVKKRQVKYKLAYYGGFRISGRQAICAIPPKHNNKTKQTKINNNKR